VNNSPSKTTKKPVSERVREMWPDIWAMVRPRRGILGLGFVLIAIKTISGFVLPASTRYLIDNVLNKHQASLLLPLTLAVVGATIVQGITSYSLTQLLSIAGQKLITELRCKVQEHIGRLPVTYYDTNKTGQLVSRIMSDVEGMRNLVGTGVIEFVGGILTAVVALVILRGSARS
jgi:subfamily B ATP-binding cassette protein MsbA